MSLGKRCHLGSMFLWKFEFHFDCNHWPRRDFVGHGLDGAEQLRRAGTVQVRWFRRFLLGANMTVFRNFPNSKSKPAIIRSIYSNIWHIFYEQNSWGSINFKRFKNHQAQLAGWMARATFASSSSSHQYGETRNVRVFLCQVCVTWLDITIFYMVWYIYIYCLYFSIYIFLSTYVEHLNHVEKQPKPPQVYFVRHNVQKKIWQLLQQPEYHWVEQGVLLEIKGVAQFPTSTEMRHLICEVQVKLQCCQVNSPKLVIDKFGCLSFSLLCVGGTHWHANDFWCCLWYTAWMGSCTSTVYLPVTICTLLCNQNFIHRFCLQTLIFLWGLHHCNDFANNAKDSWWPCALARKLLQLDSPSPRLTSLSKCCCSTTLFGERGRDREWEWKRTTDLICPFAFESTASEKEPLVFSQQPRL